MTIIRKPELLAPAGNPLALRAAVENGADAVYLAGKVFGARAYAGNFDRSELKTAFHYAHSRGVRVYITVNTLVDNREFGEFTDYLFFLYQEGVDALIIQDLGAAGLIRELLPDLPLHGSTQMTVHNAAGVMFLDDLGFERVILAREVSYSDLLEIKKNSPVELEVFVHGALCFCYSGQCLFSSMIGGRSGNRGRCAQPCRLPYHLVDEKGRDLRAGLKGEHILSPKDLMLLRELPELCRAGISSLKIEGRMKKPEYVAAVVRIYREALDRAWDNPENYSVSTQEIQDLALVFNRGFTPGYFYENPGRELIGSTKPNNRGLYLGRVIGSANRKVTLKNRLSLQAGDEIEFWTSEGCRGLTVQGISPVPPGGEVEIDVPFSVRTGDRAFKVFDQKLSAQVHESITGASRRRVPIAVRVAARLGEPLQLEARGPDGLYASAAGEFCGEKAIKHELTPAVVRAQVDRMGNTPFSLAELECEIDPGVIFPVSEINAVRRSLTSALEDALLHGFRRTLPSNLRIKEKGYWSGLNEYALTQQKKKSPTLAVAVGDMAGLRAALEGGADIVYFGGYSIRGKEPWSDELIQTGVQMCRDNDAGAFLILPRIWQEHERKFLERFLEQAHRFAADGVLAGDLGGCYLSLQDELKVVTDFSIPVFNDAAAKLLIDAGVSRMAVSPELNRKQLSDLAFNSTGLVEYIVHGAVPLVISEHCVLGAAAGKKGQCNSCREATCYLKDRRGYLFPLAWDERCRMTIYNARDLCLIEYLAEIIEAGYYNLRLELRPFAAPLVRKITSTYHKACDAVVVGNWDRGAARVAWEGLGELSRAGLTRGHYLRGVLQVDDRGEKER